MKGQSNYENTNLESNERQDREGGQPMGCDSP